MNINYANDDYLIESKVKDTIHDHLENLYFHVIKYLCMKHKQSDSWISSIRNETEIIRNSITNKSTQKEANKAFDNIASGTISNAANNAKKKAISSGNRFTDYIYPDNILKEFDFETIIDPFKVEKFLVDHAVNYEARKVLKLPQNVDTPIATILGSDVIKK